MVSSDVSELTDKPKELQKICEPESGLIKNLI
jgi:hypothetical protein